MFPISRKEISDDTSSTLWFLSPLGFRLLLRSFPPTHYSLLWTAPMAGTSTSHLLPDPLWNREETETTIGKEVRSFTDFHAKFCLMSSPVRSVHPKTRDASLLHVSFFDFASISTWSSFSGGTLRKNLFKLRIYCKGTSKRNTLVSVLPLDDSPRVFRMAAPVA